MINLLVVSADLTDGSSFYRCMGPLGELRRSSRKLNLIHHRGDIDWAMLSHLDGIFLHRPHTKEDVEIMLAGAEYGIPSWADYDDDFFSLPSDNPSHSFYSTESTRLNILRCLELASQVTVTTQALRDVYQPATKNITVIRNAHNFRLLSNFKKPASRENKIIVWRGSPTHERDLMEEAEQLIELARRYPKAQWNFVGYHPWFITENMPEGSTFFTPGMPLMEYFGYLRKLNADIHIVPLVDNAFNRSKSNCAWLEATAAGSICVARDLPSWETSSAAKYPTEGLFYQVIESFMKDEGSGLQRIHSQSENLIREGFNLFHWNKERQIVLFKMGIYL